MTDVLKFEMSEGDALFIPNHYAHAFLTTKNDVIMQYLMDDVFSQDSYQGFNGLSFLETITNIEEISISDKDANFNESIS